MTAPGRLITVEGTEGAGKSTSIRALATHLRALGVRLEVTREPGGTPLAEAIRSLLLAPRTERVTPRAELLLIFAARAQHLNERIRPALDLGTWVLCDRFTDATFAYQGGGRSMDWEEIAKLERLVQQGLQPDLTLLLDLPVGLGLERARQRSAPDRFEAEREQFFERVRAAYLRRAAQSDGRMVLIDASQPEPEVRRALIAQLDAAVRRWAGVSSAQ